MSAHTPGPWLRTDRTVFSLMPCGWRKGVEQFKNRFSFSFAFDADVSDAERDATMAVAQAAPDLLEALQAMYAAYNDITPECDKASAAIAKATGVKP